MMMRLPTLLWLALLLGGCANVCERGGRATNGAVVGTSAGLTAGFVMAGGAGALVLGATQGYLGFTLGEIADETAPAASCVAAQQAAAEEARRAKQEAAFQQMVNAPAADLGSLLADPTLTELGGDTAPIVLDDPTSVAPLDPLAAGLGGDLPDPVAVLSGALAVSAAAPDPFAFDYTPDAQGRIRLVLPSDRVFDQNSSYFNMETLPKLREMARQITERAPRLVTVVGHTDNTGSEDYNVWLSNRRAQRIAEMLRQETLEAFETYAEGKGAAEPVDEGDTEDARARNRRLEIVFEPTKR